VATSNPNRYCTIPNPVPEEGQRRAALLNQFKWPSGTVLRIKFLDGDPSLQHRVYDSAITWTGPAMANLRMQVVEDPDADIRVTFEQGNGSWSYLGTTCREIPLDEPTMNFGWLTPESDHDELHSVVCHEFGHALGLIHEHQNPNRAIAWNRKAVIADLSGPPNNWDIETIAHNIFRHYDPADIDGTETDPDSIMMYPIPASWTTDRFSADFNADLSETDRAFIRTAYPW
jgi:serralysin